MFGIVDGKIQEFAPKKEKVSSNELAVNPKNSSGYLLFNRIPTFRRKHYSQCYRKKNQHGEITEEGTIRSIMLSYDVGQKMSDNFFDNFLPDLNQSVNSSVVDDDLLNTLGLSSMFSSISRGKYLKHYIEGIANSELAYTYNLELKPIFAQNLGLLKKIDIPQPNSISGEFLFSNASISYRPNSTEGGNENKFNFSIKFAFYDTSNKKLESSFSNDNHPTFSAVINIHFSRKKLDNGGIKTEGSLIKFLKNTVQEFRKTITTELSKADMLDLTNEQLDSISSFYTSDTRHLVKFQHKNHYSNIPLKQENEFKFDENNFPALKKGI